MFAKVMPPREKKWAVGEEESNISLGSTHMFRSCPSRKRRCETKLVLSFMKGT